MNGKVQVNFYPDNNYQWAFQGNIDVCQQSGQAPLKGPFVIRWLSWVMARAASDYSQWWHTWAQQGAMTSLAAWREWGRRTLRRRGWWVGEGWKSPWSHVYVLDWRLAAGQVESWWQPQQLLWLSQMLTGVRVMNWLYDGCWWDQCCWTFGWGIWSGCGGRRLLGCMAETLRVIAMFRTTVNGCSWMILDIGHLVLTWGWPTVTATTLPVFLLLWGVDPGIKCHGVIGMTCPSIPFRPEKEKKTYLGRPNSPEVNYELIARKKSKTCSAGP